MKKKAHFLLRPESKTFSFEDVALMSDEEIDDLIMQLRWGKAGFQGCPYCGVLDKHYFIASRRIYKCKHCHKQFSLTSGSVLHSRKLPLRTIIQMLLKFILNVKGISAIAISREFHLTYKVAYAWLHKFRTMMKTSCLMEYQDNINDNSVVHLDATYIHTNNRKANKKSQRKDGRLAINANKAKRCIFAIVKTHKKHKGAKVVLPFILRNETKDIIRDIVGNNLKKGTTIYTDSSPAYYELQHNYNLHQVNHSQEYCSDSGVTNNQAESFFSRFKRGLEGQYHKMTNKYLDLYAFEFAFRENKRRLDSLSTLCELLYCGLIDSARNVMRGYNHRMAVKLEECYG